MDLNDWGKCSICGRRAAVAVNLNFCQLKSDGTIFEPSYRTQLHPQYPFLCGEHRPVLATVGGELIVPPTDAKGNGRLRYPFRYQGQYIICTPMGPVGQAATTATATPLPDNSTPSPTPQADSKSLWAAAATVPIPAGMA